MKRSTVQVKAKTIDLLKNKIILGAMALLAGIMAMAIFSTAHAKIPHSWNSYSVGEDESKLSFSSMSPVLGH